MASSSSVAPEAKRTRRVRDASEELSLDQHIALKRQALVADRLDAPSLRTRAEELRQNASHLTARWQRRLFQDLHLQAKELEEEAAERESMHREHRFESTVVTYLHTYHQRLTAAPVATKASRKSDTIQAYVRQTDLTSQRRASILDEYLNEMNQAPPKVAMSARDECPRCDGDTKLLLNSVKSIMSCPCCGYSVAYLDATSSATSFDTVVDYSSYSYKKINHFVSWIQHVQAREVHRVPDDILESVMKDLYERQNIRSLTDITQKRVRDTLRKLRLRKAYDHVAQVTSRISGARPLRISPATEEQLRNMFLQMQSAFQRHAPKTRTNFLSYPYVLYRCFQVLNLTHMLDGISLLKSRTKLEANDAIFRKMCIDLGWPVFDLPPT